MSPRLTLPPSHRLRGRLVISAIFSARIRQSAGPLTIYGGANQLLHPRLGIATSRHVGTAPRRNRIKRLLREAFRLHQHELPAIDLMVVPRPHTPLELKQYEQLLLSLSTKLAARLSRPESSDLG